MDRRYMSRKFIMACAAFLVSAGFLVAGLISPDLWGEMTRWIVGLYMAGNVGDSIASYVTKQQAQP